ncbi:uncharacterized protein KY384_000909 [Bacidia gigantensis]|uniref:uncharacterized protein n=1 Tax=Bacidia gigantensis TaxID=2732470 RepID=UPI001D042C4A|nr:uncharacterized protein KY384_000909 [Bacidia gigantensis]KAG8534066.1 hypothetical protein KY384_000909 [Bacidia gigantensis]
MSAALGSKSSGSDEEADNHTMARMLEDGNGRLLYVGDSATLSFLQLLRMIVETAAGPNDFSMDPDRHQMTEVKFQDAAISVTRLLPDKATALVLVDSFFTNTYGMVEIYSEKEFLSALDTCYAEPHSIERHWLCHFHLVLAIGLCLATPRFNTQEWELVERLRAQSPNQAEIYYATAKSLVDPLSCAGDCSLWSIQALTLLSVFMLLRSARNAAYLFVGMAIRSGYGFGLHRSETATIFSEDEKVARRRLWRSLFVLDRFLAVALGRPVAIAEEDSSGDAIPSSGFAIHDFPSSQPHHLCATGMDATIRSCHLMGMILRRVYYRRKVSIVETQSLAGLCRQWPEKLSPDLHWRQASPESPRQAIAILHCNLAYWHSIIILTRPFFLYLLSIQIQQDRLKIHVTEPRRKADMEKFSDACLIASRHTIAVIQNAYQGGYLPTLNFFPTYCLFAAALVIFVNDFTRPSKNTLDRQRMQIAIEILRYCAKDDVQASRAVRILEVFRHVLLNQAQPNPFDMQVPDGIGPVVGSYGMGLGSGMGLPGPIPMPPAASSSTRAFPSQPVVSHSNIHPEQTAGEFPLTGFIDFGKNALNNASGGTSQIADEDIDFESYWQWPDASPLPTGGYTHG